VDSIETPEFIRSLLQNIINLYLKGNMLKDTIVIVDPSKKHKIVSEVLALTPRNFTTRRSNSSARAPSGRSIWYLRPHLGQTQEERQGRGPERSAPGPEIQE
jgi:hypothetical protein